MSWLSVSYLPILETQTRHRESATRPCDVKSQLRRCRTTASEATLDFSDGQCEARVGELEEKVGVHVGQCGESAAASGHRNLVGWLGNWSWGTSSDRVQAAGRRPN
jgi:hypothetical protein